MWSLVVARLCWKQHFYGNECSSLSNQLPVTPSDEHLAIFLSSITHAGKEGLSDWSPKYKCTLCT